MSENTESGSARQTGARSGRLHSYAANPGEHVLQPSVISTLFPHLSPQRGTQFRLALLVLAGLLLVLGYFRLTGAMVAVTAAGVPLLYALYLYEIEVDQRHPGQSMAISAGTGALLGIGWALLTGHDVTHTLVLHSMPQGAPAGRIFLVAVVFPLVAQLLMLIGPIIVLRTRPAGDVLDGFDLGAASALGFVFTSTLIYLVPELHAGLLSVTASTSFALRGILRGLLVPLIDAGTTGLVAASLWLYRPRIHRVSRANLITEPVVSLMVAGIVQVILGLAAVYAQSTTAAILIYLCVGLALLFWVRLALHEMVLAEKGDVARASHAPA